jgi:NTE family protein
MPDQPLKCDAVFEGGGVKGIGLVGAVAVTEAKGYEFVNVAGTSAGAIIAALVAAGYQADELREIMASLDYTKFKDPGWVDRIPILGKAISLGIEKGIYEGEYFEEWMRTQLRKKGKRKFRDLIMDEFKDSASYRYKLRVVASDISRGKMLVLPQDARDFGIDPDELDIAHAVRMSMSIPFFFEPVTMKLPDKRDVYIVDGGVLSNFPIHLFDDGTPNPSWPTFGYLLVEEDPSRPITVRHEVRGPLSMFAALFATMMEAHDRMYIENGAFARTIPIPTKGVAATDFDLSKERAEMLYQSGRTAADAFFATWDFEQYKRNFRQVARKNRRDVLRAAASKRGPGIPA